MWERDEAVDSSPNFVLRTACVNNTNWRTSGRSESMSGPQNTSCTPSGSVSVTPRNLTPRYSGSVVPVEFAGTDCVTPIPAKCLHGDVLARLGTELDVTSRLRRKVRVPCIRQLTPYLCVGGEDVIYSDTLLSQNGITHVLNVASRDTSTTRGEVVCNRLGILYKAVDTTDDPDYPILLLHYEAFASLIDEANRNHNKVLVHCVAGVNRSVVLCVAYLVDRCNMDLLTACRIARGDDESENYV
eukprot:PhF_6_TR33603/c0_g1_i3/m.49062/K14165/K14165; atypical dual specificity phosphatase